MPASPNIVLVHGAWADGSSWSAVIERLQADGYNVTAPQFALTALADDVARLRHVLRLQSGPTLVAGHSYGGQIMTSLGTDAPNVIGLVYIAAFGLDEGESIGGLLAQGPPTPALANLSIDDQGFAWLPEDDFVGHFAADVDPVQAKVMHAVQQPLHSNALGDVMGAPAWKSLPSWFLVAEGDQAIPPDAERQFAAAHGRDHGRGRDQPRRDGLPPRRRRRAHRDGGRGGAGRGDVGLRAPGKIQAMASYSVNERGVERARRAHRRPPVRPRQRVGRGPAAGGRRERVPRVALVGRVLLLASRAHRRGERRDQGALRVRLRRLPPHPPHGPDRVPLPRRRVAPQGDRARRPRPPAAARREERLSGAGGVPKAAQAAEPLRTPPQAGPRRGATWSQKSSAWTRVV